MLGLYKAPLHRFFDPVARLLFRARVRPNHLTVLGLGVSIAAAYVFSVGRLRWGAALLAVAGLFDFFDGAVARLAGSDSDYGAFLDSVVDRPERLIALIAGATFNLLTPVMALLAVLTNVTALQRILYTRKIARDTALR